MGLCIHMCFCISWEFNCGSESRDMLNFIFLKTSRMFYNVAEPFYAPKNFLRFCKRKITLVASQEGELEEGGSSSGR